MPLQRTWEVERVALSTPGEWIEIKKKLGKDDERRRNGILLRGQTVRAGETITEFDAGPMVEEAPFATLLVAAKAWNIIDPETGRKAPLTEANMRALSDEDLALVNTRMDELYAPPLTEDEAKNS